MLFDIFHNTVEFIFPSNCIICKKRSHFSEAICTTCSPLKKQELFLEEIKSTNTSNFITCLKCQELTTELFLDTAVCPICQIYPLNAKRIRSIWHYKEEIEEIIKEYKYQKNFSLIKYFANIACKRIVEKQFFSPDFPEVIIPVPSSINLLRNREFNHNYLIAKEIAAYFEIPCYPNILTSSKKRKAQAQLEILQREQNMKDAFEAKGKILKNKKILLFDDVLTSGATINSACRALFKTNCRQIDVLTLARSLNFSKNRVLISIG